MVSFGWPPSAMSRAAILLALVVVCSCQAFTAPAASSPATSAPAVVSPAVVSPAVTPDISAELPVNAREAWGGLPIKMLRGEIDPSHTLHLTAVSADGRWALGQVWQRRDPRT